MKISFRWAVTGVIVVGLGVGAGAAAYQSGLKQATPALAQAAAPQGAALSGGQIPGAQASQQGGRPTMGAVEKVGDKEFSVKDSSNDSSVTVRVNEQTAIQKQVAGTLSDIKQGARITVRGGSQADGSITATAIQLAPAGAGALMIIGNGGGQSRGQQGNSADQSSGQQSQGAARPGQADSQQGGRTGSRQGTTGDGAQGAGAILGTVNSVNGNVISLTRMGGSADQSSPLNVTVSDKTAVTQTGTGDFKDITQGASVVAIGPRGADGVVVASSVQILPADAAQMMRGR